MVGVSSRMDHQLRRHGYCGRARLARRRERLTRIALLLFAIQIVVGLVSIPLVYGFHSLLLGLLLDIFALLLALGTTWMFRRIAYQAAWWMLPYVVWLVYTMVSSSSCGVSIKDFILTSKKPINITCLSVFYAPGLDEYSEYSPEREMIGDCMSFFLAFFKGMIRKKRTPYKTSSTSKYTIQKAIVNPYREEEKQMAIRFIVVYYLRDASSKNGDQLLHGICISGRYFIVSSHKKGRDGRSCTVPISFQTFEP